MITARVTISLGADDPSNAIIKLGMSYMKCTHCTCAPSASVQSLLHQSLTFLKYTYFAFNVDVNTQFNENQAAFIMSKECCKVQWSIAMLRDIQKTNRPCKT